MLTVILCAAGSGNRAGLQDNKIFFPLGGLPVLSRSLSAFAPYADEILIPCRKEDEGRISALLAPFPQARTVPGGATRAESVYRALKVCSSDMVLVHDAARPFVTAKMIEDCIRSAEEYGSGVCAVPATDTVFLYGDGKMTNLPRAEVYHGQTPQGFCTAELLRAYGLAAEHGDLGTFTDDAGLYAAYIKSPRLVEGDRRNRKLTFPEDFSPAERVGFGVDTHAFAHQDEIDRGIARLNLNYIKLCGAAIPSDRAIEAHSDGDAAVHALMDALLSAIGERDIGYFFPDTDPAYRGADSMKLLAQVMEKVHKAGYVPLNVSVSVVAEKPRLSPYIGTMRKNLAAALQIGTDAVGIAAGTNEGLGYVGEGKGITCYAMALLGAKT